MSVSTTTVTAASSKVSSASFKLKCKRTEVNQGQIKKSFFALLIKSFRPQAALHGINPCVSRDKDTNYSLNQLIIFQMSYTSFAKLTEEPSLSFFGLTIFDSCYCSHCTLVNGIWFLPLIHLYRVLKLEPCDLEAVLEKKVYSSPR